MPRIKESERVRKRTAKTRSGCKTCKIRRVKCDETTPYCVKCTSTGRRCDGYGPADDGSLLHLNATTPSGLCESSSEARAFALFQQKTSVQLSGFTECEFWTRTILQAAHTDSSIKHAIIALASLHDVFQNHGHIKDAGGRFALQQYDLAIRKQRKSITDFHRPEDVDNYVASCVLFICIEALQGHYMSASSLVRGACKMFYDTHVFDCKTSAWDLGVLERWLSRFQFEALSLLGPEVSGTMLPHHFRDLPTSGMPKQFASICEALIWLEETAHLHTISPCEDNKAVPDLSLKKLFKDSLAQWTSAFDAMRASLKGPMTPQDEHAIAVLKFRRMIILVAVETAAKHPHVRSGEVPWDDYLETFKEFLDCAEKACKTQRAAFTTSTERPYVFTLAFSHVAPLFDCARYCRYPDLRRRAIAILRENPCREGLWDSVMAAQIAQHQMEIEESAVEVVRTAGDIPQWARVVSTVPAFSPGQHKAFVEFERLSGGIDGTSHKFKEVVEW